MKAKVTPNAPLYRLKTITRSAILLILLGLLAIPFFSSAARGLRSVPTPPSDNQVTQESNQSAKLPGLLSPNFLMPQGGGETIAIFEGDCTTPATDFDLGDAICVKLTGAPIGTRIRRRIAIVNPAGIIMAKADVTSSPQTLNFTLPSAASSVLEVNTVDNRGTWRVNNISTEDALVKTGETFIVHDPVVPVASLSITKNAANELASSGSTVGFTVLVANSGPDAATSVQFTDDVPANSTFLSASQDSGPTFTCTDPGVGNTGTTTCTIASLANGNEAKFTFLYQLNSGLADGTLITNTATVSSATVERHAPDNSSTAIIRISAGGGGVACTLDCPADKVVTANTTQGGNPGAFVTYGAAAGAGTCGAITNSIPSGSFFQVGTHTITSSAESGQSCSFTVTVLNTPAPTISCPADVTATDDGSGSATVSVGTPTFTPSGATVVGVRSDSTPTVYDEEGNVVTPGVNKPLTDPYPTGITGITWTVTDSDGRTASCLQRVTVNAVCLSDTGNPVITAPDDVIRTTGGDNTVCTV